MKLFDYQKESRRLVRMIKSNGLQVLEDLLLSAEMAVLDVSMLRHPESREDRKAYTKYHRAVGKAKADLLRARYRLNLK